MELNLDSLKSLLDQYGFAYTDLARSETLPYDQLFVSLGEDFKERPWLLNIRLFEQAYEGPQEEVAEGAPKKLYFLNFFIVLPFEAKEAAFNDLARLALLTNRVLPFPGFGLSELDRAIYYQYTQMTVKSELDPDQFLATIALIIHYLNTHLPTFEVVGSGEKTLQQVLTEAAQAVNELAA